MTLLEQIDANKFTIAELEAVLEVLDQMVRGDLVELVKVKIRWHIAASRNEVDHD